MPIDPELFRPTYHYTPRRNFMNDPSGLTFLDGQFLLFHQFNPLGNEWGHMSWKQAMSSDLIHWTHLPVALAEEDGIMIFSGSAVVDSDNTSGFGRAGISPVVAIYTGHRAHDKMESPCLAYSLDRGLTWNKCADNPVLPWEPEFRDPKVFWHEETGCWIMLVVKAADKVMRIYRSHNLRSWDYVSCFGPEGADAATIANWECPDLFALPIETPLETPGADAPAGVAVEMSGQFRWVLHINVGSGHPNGGSGGQYFVGDFDGTRFVNANPNDTVLWSDWGKDNYASISWSGIAGPQHEKYWIGWMCNWQYAEKVPTHPWRNGLTLPRMLTLRPTAGGLRLVQKPVPQLSALRGERRAWKALSLPAARPVVLEEVAGVAFEIEAEFDLETATEFGLAVRAGETERILIGIDAARKEIFVDRTHSGLACSEHFAGRHTAPLPDMAQRVQLHVFVDAGSVEVFVNDGIVALTELIFPGPESRAIYAYADGGAARLVSLHLWQLKPATACYCDAETSDEEETDGDPK